MAKAVAVMDLSSGGRAVSSLSRELGPNLIEPRPGGVLFSQCHQIIILPSRTFPGFHYLGKVARGLKTGLRNMTGHLVETLRDSFMEAAQKELIAFERKEREFRKREKQERAEQLQMPALKPLHS
jgi:hypothetical protein